ncbi:hypothetical protein BofuT4_uP015790.1 [Botrytis cinerea T4]|uniref:Uncharacterized protein n=1 Tax=Botryotinia fuckeliana (strain T4) TaxID=999810 RepID=G2YHT6_BOTF4|nr:hypothetical protein BofuT4_uP015790.1 [Botrytis cinerea T4]
MLLLPFSIIPSIYPAHLHIPFEPYRDVFDRNIIQPQS